MPPVTLPFPELCRHSAVELARLIRTKQASPLEVVDAHIQRISAVNPHTNAVIQPLFDRAREQAKAAGERLANTSDVSTLPPFLGVPFTSKEHFAVEGLPQTAGLLKRANKIATKDSILVKRMRDAGFVLLGTTNVPEALFWYETYNKVYGRTTNGTSIHHTPGGSSGGEGSVLGSGGSPVGLGGDIGGSLRNPAFFNGIATHKSTGGRIPETGAWPGAKGKIGRYKVCGPMAKRLEDVVATLPILAGPDGVDQSVDGPAWGKAPAFDPKRLKVYWFDDLGVPGTACADDVLRNVQAAVRALESMGFRTERWRPPGVERAPEIWANALKEAGGGKFIESLSDFGEHPSLLRQWAKWPLRKSDHILPSLGLATIEAALARFPEYGRKMSDQRLVLQAAIEEKLGDDGVLLFPTFHRTAPKHGLDALRSFVGFTYCAVLNPLELPATAVPTGIGDDGLPLGLQVAGKRYADHLTLFVGARLEEWSGGWRPRRLMGVEAV